MKGRRPNPWAKPDMYTEKAKARGFPARSVFKLEEIDRRCRLFRSGQRVLDLGCAPGSWLLYAAGKVGPSGRVRGIDLTALDIGMPPQAQARVGDALTPDEETSAFLAEGAPYDVVLSDMAPATSGNKMTDQARSAELVRSTLMVAERYLAEGGSWVAKLFMSSDLAAIRTEIRALFREERIVRPEATRTVSTEVFLVGLGRRKVGP